MDRLSERVSSFSKIYVTARVPSAKLRHWTLSRGQNRVLKDMLYAVRWAIIQFLTETLPAKSTADDVCQLSHMTFQFYYFGLLRS